MKAILSVILNQENEKIYQEVKQQLLEIKSDLSISPYIDYQGRKDHIIFNVTMNIEENAIKPFIDALSDSIDGEYDDCEAYGQFVKMFNEHVYYYSFYTC